MDLDEEVQEEQSIMEEQVYDCVICNQTTPSTEDHPVGLVTLLQPTSGKDSQCVLYYKQLLNYAAESLFIRFRPILLSMYT